MTQLTFAPLFRLDIEVHPFNMIGPVPTGFTRRITSIAGGRFKGSRLAGRILHGNDAVVVRPDGGARIDVRAVLETDAGELIYMTYQGQRNGSPELLARIARAEPIPPNSDYFRCSFQFETSAPSLLWLNNIISVGTGVRDETGLYYEVFEVL